MKKKLSITLIILMCLLLSACGNDSASKAQDNLPNTKGDNLDVATYTADLGEVKQTTILRHKKDEVKKIEQEMEFSLSAVGLDAGGALGDKEKEAIKEQFASQYNVYKDETGVSIDSSFSDDAMTIKIVMDLDKVDDETASALLMNIPNPKSLKETADYLKAQGYSEK